jgi:hypothetical protein
MEVSAPCFLTPTTVKFCKLSNIGYFHATHTGSIVTDNLYIKFKYACEFSKTLTVLTLTLMKLNCIRKILRSAGCTSLLYSIHTLFILKGTTNPVFIFIYKIYSFFFCKGLTEASFKYSER